MLINPPAKFYGGSKKFNLYVPIGLLSIASISRDSCELKIFDCLIENFKIDEKDECALYGTPYEDIRKEINNYKPDIVGISIPFSAQSEQAIRICNICKDINPNIIVVFGGPDASVRYKQLLKETKCDYCAVGEGEMTFLDLVNNFNEGKDLKDVKGVAHKINDEIIFNEREFISDLDLLPFPAYDMVNMENYINNKYLYATRKHFKNGINFITSRGCPYNCVFCSVKSHMGKKYRAHSTDYVIRHMKLLIESYGINNFHFEDDNISFDKKRFEEILDRIISENLNIKWSTPNGVRADTLNFELLKKIKKSGCVKLIIAIESGNQAVLDNIIKKSMSLEYAVKIIKYCKEIGIETAAFYVIGFPGEKIENIKETIDLALKLFKDYSVQPILTVATPLHGTELYNECIKKGFIDNKIVEFQKELIHRLDGKHLISTNDFNAKDIDSMIKYFNNKRYQIEITKTKSSYQKKILKKFKKLLEKFMAHMFTG